MACIHSASCLGMPCVAGPPCLKPAFLPPPPPASASLCFWRARERMAAGASRPQRHWMRHA
eukprot:2831675-Pyramimonas_sp.AAC.1